MPGPDRRRRAGRRDQRPQKTANPLQRARSLPRSAETTDAVPVATPSTPVTGPYITLAQLVKKLDLAPTGGAAKQFVRSGGIIVNGQSEDRPGRKLVNGDKVEIDGQTVTVQVEE